MLVCTHVLLCVRRSSYYCMQGQTDRYGLEDLLQTLHRRRLNVISMETENKQLLACLLMCTFGVQYSVCTWCLLCDGQGVVGKLGMESAEASRR